MNTETITRIKNQVTETETSARVIAGQLDETSDMASLLLNKMIAEIEETLYKVEGDQRFKLMNLMESLSSIKSSIIGLQNLYFRLVAHKLSQLHEDLSKVNISDIE